MDGDEKFIPVVGLDTINVPLTNIRLHLDGTHLVVDLIPSVLGEVHIERIDGLTSQEVLASMREYQDADHFVRVHFYPIWAIALTEESIEIFDDLEPRIADIPKLPNSGWAFPFLRVENSRWRTRIREDIREDNPDLQHFMILSMATCIDVLGHMEKFEILREE